MTRRVILQAAALLALAVLPAVGEAIYYRSRISWQSRLPNDQTVDIDLARSWADKALWVDARPDNDFAQGHVPGAISLNEDRWNDLFPEFQNHWSPEKKIVVYCSSQSCNLAEDVARRLRHEAKLPNDIRVLQGGWEEWQRKSK